MKISLLGLRIQKLIYVSIASIYKTKCHIESLTNYYDAQFNNCMLFQQQPELIYLEFFVGTSAGNVGLALTQVFQLTKYVQRSIKKWIYLENGMICVERTAEYTNLEQESKEGNALENWPLKGSIQFEKVDLCYEGCKTLVLKRISFEIKSKERIGIVGRTGAGKSSFFTVLCRLTEFGGKIEIDGIDTKTVSLECLR